MFGHPFTAVEMGKIVRETRFAGAVVCKYQSAIGKRIIAVEVFAFFADRFETAAQCLDDNVVVGHSIKLLCVLRKQLLHETFLVSF